MSHDEFRSKNIEEATEMFNWFKEIVEIYECDNIISWDPNKNKTKRTEMVLSIMSLYNFDKSRYVLRARAKGDNRPSENLILEPIPMSELFFRFRYTIYSEDIHKMMCIFQKISRADLTNNSIRIACNRFLRSHHNLLPDDRLIDLCIAMEALFLGGEYQKSDLGMGQVIGLACSMLIGRENTERKDIRDTIESGFNLRNKVVHGYEIDYNRRKRIGEILPDFEDSLRRSILRLL